MEFIGIIVRQDNIMYLFYNCIKAFCVDGYNPDLIEIALKKSLIHGTIYTAEELKALDNIDNIRKLTHCLTTHHHFDHSGGDKIIKERFNPVMINFNTIKDCTVITEYNIKPIHTPCHTADSVCFLIDNKYFITGDTIFFLGVGRFFEGTGRQMVENIEKIKDKVPKDALMLYGHDYSEINSLFAREYMDIPYKITNKCFLTLEEEIKYNPFFNYRKLINKGKIESMDDLRNKKDNFKHKV